MAIKRILTIGFELAATDSHYEGFDSKASLLDYDIIMFKPEINKFLGFNEFYQGKPSLSDSASFGVKECCEHWRREIKQACDAGKTVIVFLASLKEVFVDTGHRTYSGTGRNRATTQHVAPYNNYEAIPAELLPVTANGSSIKLSTRAPQALTPYWAEFESFSSYKVILTARDVPVCLVTRTGDKSVGAVYQSKSSSGNLLLLPDIDFYPTNFLKSVNKGQTWTVAAREFAGRLVSAVVSLDKALRANSELTPEPSWATDAKFILKNESDLRTQLLEAEDIVKKAQKRKEQLSEQLKSAGRYRGLLFEKGKPLENVIIEALRLLGFTASPFRDSASEFDVVFESVEGRLVGEAEGKDNKAINIEKLRQLSMNVFEDLQRESVTTPAKAVLFGNGFRLDPLSKRGDPFTEKCQSAAVSSLTALVFTPDLFWPVQYLVDSSDSVYAESCRRVLLTSSGRVVFPDPPVEEHERQKPSVVKVS